MKKSMNFNRYTRDDVMGGHLRRREDGIKPRSGIGYEQPVNSKLT
jgi:hypothetical protein